MLNNTNLPSLKYFQGTGYQKTAKTCYLTDLIETFAQLRSDNFFDSERYRVCLQIVSSNFYLEKKIFALPKCSDL